MKKISLAYSPDSDDAFMVYALKERCIDLGDYEFEFTSLDIQQLNELATQKVFDITAISFAVYPKIAQDYWLMEVGASIGDEFGPAVVVRSNSTFASLEDLEGKTIAIPGMHTSANFALHACLGKNFKSLYRPFHGIASAVASGEADAGVLIHELQLSYPEEGFRKIADLGKLWFKHFRLPLPLGGNAIKRELGRDAVQNLTRIYRESINWALGHRAEVLPKATARALSGLKNPELAEQYISMYVNHRSLNYDAAVNEAIQILFKKGAEFGFCSDVSMQPIFFS